MIVKKNTSTKKRPAANYIMEINQNFGKPSLSLKSVQFEKVAFHSAKKGPQIVRIFSLT